MNIGCSWSGGKDSCFALMDTLRKDFQLRALVNMMNENGLISRSHGLPISILQQQADAMNVSLITRATSWDKYQDNFVESLEIIANDYDVKAIVFGDIDLQQHRDWEEMVCTKAGLTAILPLWKKDRKELVMKMLNEGIECMIVSCNTTMGERFPGRVMTLKLVAELEKMGIDVCGENGEFHTVVINCPLFQHAIKLPAYSTILHENYWFLQWQS
jgi:diphthine-ammonia ligase